MNKNQTSSVCPLGHTILPANLFSGVFKMAMVLLLIGSIILPLKAVPPCDPITANANGTAPSSCGACDGSATVNASEGTAPYTYLWSTGATTQSIGGSSSGGTRRCIDAGNITAAYTYSNGDIFTIDSFYTPPTSTTVTPGTVVYSCSNTVDILGTTDDAMFRNERNIAIAGGTMTYNIPAINGTYDVELYFAELFYGVTGGNTTPPFTGKRKFDVFIEGIQVLNDYDVNADVGPATAVIKTYTTIVTDGTVTIDFTSVLNRAKVNGICIKPHAQISAGQGLCAGEYSVTVTDATGCTGVGTVALIPNCDDNNLCTADACSGSECAHTPIDCNDNDACTDDFCDAATGCYSLPHSCDDSDLCTDDLCDNSTGCSHLNISCNDANDCTNDFCDAISGCYHPDVNCDDGDACTTDACESGTAVAIVIDVCSHTPINCDDNNECTDDVCAEGICSQTEIPGCNDPCKNVICDDEDNCTTDLCDAGDCVYTEILCSDDDICTQDACIVGDCFYFSDNCDDSDACTNDICLGNGFCDYEPVICNDNDACTDDACESGNCVFTPIACNDNDQCTSDVCDNGQCVYITITCDDGDACTEDNCYEGCLHTTISCNDLDACTEDACEEGLCINTTIDCNDNDVCTTDNCSEGNCLNTAIPDCGIDPCENADCNDNDGCTTDMCDAGICSNTALICDDADACTNDVCDNGQCIFTIIDCNDNDACTADACNAGICANTAIICGDANACTNDACENGQCVFTAISCDDGNACTNNSCVNGQCVYPAIVCDDNDDCTIDACNAGICSNSPQICNDNDACTTDNCVSGRCNFKPLNCNDDNACTLDACNSGVCSNQPLNCDDANSCTNDICNNGICGHTNICDPCTLQVTSFTLINALTDTELGLFEDGGVINLFYTPNVNIRANLCVTPVGSVKFNLNVQTYKIENTAPYAMAGDNPIGDYNKWNVSVGAYTLTALPFTGASATGTQGTGKTIHFTVINQEILCSTALDCEDGNACTADNCDSGIGCINTPISGCCNSEADCDDNNLCTTDACEENECVFTADGNSEPSYLHVVNTGRSWKKLKLGYSSTSLYAPKQNVVAGGNNQLCVTLRGNAATDWSKIQIRPQGSLSLPVSLSGYGLGTSFTEICIPLAAFGASVDFTKLTLIEIPYSNGAGAFEIDIQKIEFRGGATPFLWFGESKTNNFNDSGSGGALLATLVEGSPCGSASKMSASAQPQLKGNSLLIAYPNPFNEQLNIEFSLPADAHVKLEIFNLAGQRIAELFEGNVKGGELQKVEFSPEAASEGMFIYRLQTEQGIYFGKAVMVK